MQIGWKTVLCTVAVVAVAAFLVRSEPASAQDGKGAPPVQDAKTKLEAFDAKSGVVVVRGFSAIGTVRGDFSTSAAVECKEFIDASSGRREFGIAVTVTKEEKYGSRDSTSFIDYDEIDSLMKGIEYIAKIDKSVTKLKSFQADYRTKGDLEVSTYSAGGQGGTVQAGIKSGRIGSVLAFLDMEHLDVFKALVVKAKETLDEIRK